ncbi:hypothetical protein KY363_06415 [Candidatus Woesearchaeota archaeon]|nr:hypothetical protein [Candidatus Woesearchaeota archaeon]
MTKRDPLRTSFMFLMIAFLVVFAAGSFVAYLQKQDIEVRSETLDISNSNVIRVPDSNQPVPNPDEGTLVLWTKQNIEIFDQFRDARDYIIFFTATNLQGLRIAYNIAEERFEAGMPLLATPKINIFDKADHQFVYTWKKGVEQALYLDGQKVRSSSFTPISTSDIVGMSIADIEQYDEADIAGIEVAHYDRYMTAEELNKI